MMEQTAQTWKIRRATNHDLPEIYALEQECFLSPWSAEMLLMDICVNEDNLYYVMEHAGRVIGFLGMNIIIDEAHIRKICVAPDMRGHGYGTRMLERAEQKAVEQGAIGLTLEVRASNAPAIRMYEAFGFVTEGIRKKYYDGKEDACIMWKHGIGQENHEH